ncbi:hypothetical protein AALT_g9613 [Alternaria alternata]|jgi:hypothetical protein|nr:hypothetical protein AALT_g9613 [Alternaria alternata]
MHSPGAVVAHPPYHRPPVWLPYCVQLLLVFYVSMSLGQPAGASPVDTSISVVRQLSPTPVKPVSARFYPAVNFDLHSPLPQAESDLGSGNLRPSPMEQLNTTCFPESTGHDIFNS